VTFLAQGVLRKTLQDPNNIYKETVQKYKTRT